MAIAAEPEKKWDNGVYDPSLYYKDRFVDALTIEAQQNIAIRDGWRAPRASDWVQMLVENRDSPLPTVRPFLIVQVLDPAVGLVNGMLFLADSDVREPNPGILGLGMSQTVRACGFEVPSNARGVFWLNNVRFHPQGLPRQSTQMVEKPTGACGDCGHGIGYHRTDPEDICTACECKEYKRVFELVEEPLWEDVAHTQPQLECTWRWPQ